MNYPLFIARRLSLAAGGHRSSPAVTVATAAVALSVAVMIAAIAIVTGFKDEITDKVVGFNSHITILSAATPDNEDFDSRILLSSSLSEILDSAPYITDYSLQASMPAILKTDSDFKGVYLKNPASGQGIPFLRNSLEEGTLPDFSNPADSNSILISRRAANALNLHVGDRVNTYFLSDEVRVRPLHIAGIYNSHFDSYDDIFIYGSLSLIQQLSGLSSREGTSVHITTDDIDHVDDYATILGNELAMGLADGRLYRPLRTESAHVRGAGYFQWLNLLDTNVIVILSLMTAVACITLVSGMLIVIADKKRFIGIMKALGCDNRRLRRIFIFLALRITLLGLLIGNFFAITLLLLQQKLHFIPLDPDSYYIDFVPVQLDWIAILLLNIVVTIIVWIVLILPSRAVAKVAPATAIRNE